MAKMPLASCTEQRDGKKHSFVARSGVPQYARSASDGDDAASVVYRAARRAPLPDSADYGLPPTASQGASTAPAQPTATASRAARAMAGDRQGATPSAIHASLRRIAPFEGGLGGRPLNPKRAESGRVVGILATRACPEHHTPPPPDEGCVMRARGSSPQAPTP